MNMQKNKLWSFLFLLFFVIGVIVLPTLHKANVSSFSPWRYGSQTKPIKKDTEKKPVRSEHNPATCLMCRLASTHFASPTPLVILVVETFHILSCTVSSTTIMAPALLGLPPVRAPPSERS